MRVIIAGSRSLGSVELVAQAVQASGFTITEVVHGGAHGVDFFAKLWAERQGIPVRTFWADWNRLGKSAGPSRNRKMADYANALVAIWDGKSKGTKNMIEEARARDMPTFILIGGDR